MITKYLYNSLKNISIKFIFFNSIIYFLNIFFLFFYKKIIYYYCVFKLLNKLASSLRIL